jgi:hypothetical protein
MLFSDANEYIAAQIGCVVSRYCLLVFYGVGDIYLNKSDMQKVPNSFSSLDLHLVAIEKNLNAMVEIPRILALLTLPPFPPCIF